MIAAVLLGATASAEANPPVFDFSFGATGTGNGEFKDPYGVATDSEGNIWVADYANNRIQQLDATGKYLDQAGSTGSGNGQFSGPADVAIDSEDNLWVSDLGNSRIQKFDSEGNYLDQVGSEGSGGGKFKVPWGLGIDGEDSVWVADAYNHRIQMSGRTAARIAPTSTSWPGMAALRSARTCRG